MFVGSTIGKLPGKGWAHASCIVGTNPRRRHRRETTLTKLGDLLDPQTTPALMAYSTHPTVADKPGRGPVEARERQRQDSHAQGNAATGTREER